jgi:hypothetical protein
MSKAVMRLDRQHALEPSIELRRDLEARQDGWNRATKPLGQSARELRRIERESSTHEVVREHTDGIEVRPGSFEGRLRHELLGGHEGRRADDERVVS